jgi:hypothetical protein
MPLLMPDPKKPKIVLILMPLILLQQNQADNVIKRGDYLGAKCIVIDQDSRADVDMVEKSVNSHNKGVLRHEG